MCLLLCLYRIISLCQANPDGISDDMILTDMPQFDVKQRVMAINRLLSKVNNSGVHYVHVGGFNGQFFVFFCEIIFFSVLLLCV